MSDEKKPKPEDEPKVEEPKVPEAKVAEGLTPWPKDKEPADPEFRSS